MWIINKNMVGILGLRTTCLAAQVMLLCSYLIFCGVFLRYDNGAQSWWCLQGIISSCQLYWLHNSAYLNLFIKSSLNICRTQCGAVCYREVDWGSFKRIDEVWATPWDLWAFTAIHQTDRQPWLWEKGKKTSIPHSLKAQAVAVSCLHSAGHPCRHCLTGFFSLPSLNFLNSKRRCRFWGSKSKRYSQGVTELASKLNLWLQNPDPLHPLELCMPGFA